MSDGIEALLLNEVGVAALEAGDLRTAGAALEVALILAPDSPDILFNRGLVCERSGETTCARELYERITNLDGRHVKALVHLGNLSANAGITDEAEEFYRRALSVDESYFPAHYNYAVLLEKLRSLADAREAYKWATRVNSASTDAWLGLSRVENGRGNTRGAGDALKQAITTAKSANDLFQIGTTCAQLNELALAEEALSAALDRDQTHVESRYTLAVVRWFGGDQKSALRDVRQARRDAERERRADLIERCIALEEDILRNDKPAD